MIEFVKKLIHSIAILGFISSCAHRSAPVKPPAYEAKMTLQDKSGKFSVVKESGLAKNKKSYVTKYRVYSIEGAGKKNLEQSIVFSVPGLLGNKVRVMRPERSQFKVWFDKQLYQTETIVDTKKKALIVKMDSPEKQWKGEKTFIFPGGNGIFCYFTQLFECVKYTGFIEKAIKAGKGKADFHVLWDGYPYFQEQYLNIENSPFASAEMEYDGKTENGEHRFSVSVSGNAIFYLYSEGKEYVKMFWPAQGLSLFDEK
jgi:hypothetical protein